jgi:pre-mRNA-splicing factor RBM22/SLT11
MPIEGELAHQNIKDRYYGVNDPVAKKILNRARDKLTVHPPKDSDLKTLYIGNVDSRISEQDLKYASLTHTHTHTLSLSLHILISSLSHLYQYYQTFII